jgi:protein-tyrosine-phosphatase
MVSDSSLTLGRRAAVHSALGDLARLAIVDMLIAGDLSASTLGDALGIRSNLLAHHIGVLDRAGVLRRIRSEGDRRRSYLSLVPGVLDSLIPDSAVTGPRIVFVCTENVARSQLAAAIWADASVVPVTSAGTHPGVEIHPGALAAARRRQLRLAPRKPRAVDVVIQPGDIVITVCDRANEELAATHRHWSVPDPVKPATEEAFDLAVDELATRIERFAQRTQSA